MLKRFLFVVVPAILLVSCNSGSEKKEVVAAEDSTVAKLKSPELKVVNEKLK